ncbi:MAG: alpha/beta hydrolase [Pseudomonadota bacterium]
MASSERQKASLPDLLNKQRLAEQGHLEVGSQRLEYRLWPGSPDKPLILLLHEGLGSVALWRDFPAALAAATGCSVFAYSRAGYGGSSACVLPRPLSYMEDEARHTLPFLLKELPAKQLILLGHSDGASIAAVSAGVAADPRLRGLILLAPHFFTEQVSVTAITATREAYETGDLRRRLARYHGENVDCAFEGWADSWLHPDFRRWDLRTYLPTIQVPTLVIQGEGDEYGTAAHVETAASLIPGRVDTHLLPSCGHAPQTDQRERVLRLVSGFLGSLG